MQKTTPEGASFRGDGYFSVSISFARGQFA